MFYVTRDPSLGNEHLKNQLNLSVFTLDLMKSGKAWRNMIGQIAWAKCCTLGEICKAHSFGFWLVSLHLRNRKTPFLMNRQALFTCGSYDLLQGRKREGESKRRSSFCQSLKHLQLIQYAKEPYFGLSCPEFHQEKEMWEITGGKKERGDQDGEYM